jgi:hypothetical protein
VRGAAGGAACGGGSHATSASAKQAKTRIMFGPTLPRSLVKGEPP